MYNKILIPVEGREGAWRAIRSSTQAVPLLAEGGEILRRIQCPVIYAEVRLFYAVDML